MEYYQTIQNRTAQTAAVINQWLPTLSLGGVTAAELLGQSAALAALAQARDDALAAFDAADNAENRAFLALQALTIALPKVAEGELDDAVAAESALLDLLSPVYAIAPRTPESALERGRKLTSALTRINDYFAGLTPARPPVTSGGKGVGEVSAAMAALPAVAQALEDRAAEVTAARTALRTAATALDRLNKRFYSRLKAEARDHPALAQALAQITTTAAGLPAILGIRKILQGGADNRQLHQRLVRRQRHEQRRMAGRRSRRKLRPQRPRRPQRQRHRTLRQRPDGETAHTRAQWQQNDQRQRADADDHVSAKPQDDAAALGGLEWLLARRSIPAALRSLQCRPMTPRPGRNPMASTMDGGDFKARCLKLLDGSRSGAGRSLARPAPWNVRLGRSYS